jgi:hypothetical protein
VAAVVQQIFTTFTDPLLPATLYQVAKQLSDAGIPTPRGQVRWNVATIRGILRSPVYIGQAACGRTRPVAAQRRKSALQPVGSGVSQRPTPPEDWISIPVPALVSQEQFEVAQVRLNQNKQFARRNTTAHDYLLRGLVSCAKCLLTCTGRMVHPGYDYSVCAGRTDSLRAAQAERCEARYIPADRLDELVWQDLCRVLREPALLTHELLRAQGGEWLPQAMGAQRKTVQQALAQLERQQARLLEVYLAEVVGRGEFERKRQELARAQQGLQTQLRQLDVQAQQQLDVMGLADGLTAFCQRIASTLEELDFTQRRQLVELLIDRVVVADSAVEIRYVVPTGSAGESVPFCHLRLDYFDVHPLEVMAEHPATWWEIGHHDTQFSRTGRRGPCPGDRQVAEPIGFAGQAHAWQIAALALLDAEGISGQLDTTGKGNHGVVGDPNDVIPAQVAALAGPRAIAEATVGEEGHAAGALEQLRDVIEHGIAHLQFDVAFAGANFPGERERAVTVREREAQDLERFVSNEAAIQHDGDLAASPGLQHVGNDWCIEIATDDPAACEPAANAHNPSCRFCLRGNVIGDFAEMDRLTLDEADNHPYPDGEALEV